ncbi:MAG: glycosyltransferase, partial [Fidelibacterota bacterium]
MNNQDKVLRILFIFDNRWWSASSYYGYICARALIKRGHKVYAMGDVNSPVMKKCMGGEFALNLEFKPFSYSPFAGFKNLSISGTLFKKFHWDILAPHGPAAHLWASLARLIFAENIKVIRFLSDNMPVKIHFFNKLLHRSLTHGHIASSASLKERYRNALRIDGERMRVITGGIDLNSLTSREKSDLDLRKFYNVDGDYTVVGLIARLSPVKGHSCFIEAADMVRRSYTKVKFLIAGEEDQLNFRELKDLIGQKGLDDYFIFRSRDENVRAVLNFVDIGVIASTFSEVVCRICMEYMSFCKPV